MKNSFYSIFHDTTSSDVRGGYCSNKDTKNASKKIAINAKKYINKNSNANVSTKDIEKLASESMRQNITGNYCSRVRTSNGSEYFANGMMKLMPNNSGNGGCGCVGIIVVAVILLVLSFLVYNFLLSGGE